MNGIHQDLGVGVRVVHAPTPDLGPRRADVERLPRRHLDHEERLVNVLRQLAEPPLTRAQRIVGALPFGHVRHERQHPAPPPPFPFTPPPPPPHPPTPPLPLYSPP